MRTNGKMPAVRDWQKRGWVCFDEISIIKYATRYRSNVISRVRLLPAYRTRDSIRPVPLTDLLDMDDTPAGLTAQYVEDAWAAIDRIRSGHGSQGEIMRNLSVCLDIPGEALLIGHIDAETLAESWHVVAVDELARNGSQITFPGDDGVRVVLTEDSQVFRVWRRHEHRRAEADSNIRALLDDAEEYLLLRNGNIAIASSRIAQAGVLIRSTRYDLPIERPLTHSDETTPSSTSDEFHQAGVAAIADTRSPSAVLPITWDVDAPADEIASLMHHVALSRPLDRDAIERMEAIRTAMMEGIDLPPERIRGLGESSTFANAELVSRDEFEAHLEPAVQLMCDAFTQAVLQASLMALGYPRELVERTVVAFDPSQAITDPQRVDNAKEAHKAGPLSDAALMRELGFSTGDMATEEELLRRRALTATTDGAITDALLRLLLPDLVIPRTQFVPGAVIVTESGEVVAEQPLESEVIPGEAGVEQAALTAGATLDPQAIVDALSWMLADLDRLAMVEIQRVADETARDAMRHIGVRLRSAAQGDSTLRESLRGVPNRDVAAVLGPRIAGQLAEQAGVSVDEVIAEHRDQFDAAVLAVQAAALDAIARASEETGGTLDRESVQAQQSDDRSEAWLLMAGLLTAWITAKVTAVEQADGGEIPLAALVPGDIVRQVAGRAGGMGGVALGPGGSVTTVAGVPVPGVLSGPTLQQTVAQALRVRYVGAEWIYGPIVLRQQPFPPHLELSGKIVGTWEDASLSNGATFPVTTSYYPGDHAGCRCTWRDVWATTIGD